MTENSRKLTVRIAGALLMLLAVGAALLPMASQIGERVVIGTLLIAAGAIELTAMVARPGRHIFAGLAAAASLLAGLRLALDPSANFVTVLNLVILWLVVRSVALFFSSREAERSHCNWIYMASAVDLLLALLLLAGLPVTVLVYGLFGEISPVLGTFAWILAGSFVAAGLLLFAVAPQGGEGGADVRNRRLRRSRGRAAAR